MSATVSVICTFLNAEDTLAATLESMRGQIFADARFVLVDDGSRDHGAAIAARFSAVDQRFILLANPNPGRIRALNLALAQADTEYVAILDADDVAHPLWLADGLAAMRKEIEFAVIGFDRLLIRNLAEPDWSDTIRRGNAELNNVTRHMARGNVIGHSGAMMRKAQLARVGGYDESLPYLEDYDLWIRLAEAGCMLGRSSLVRIAKRYHDGQKFGSAPKLLLASWRMQLRAVMAIDRSYQSFLSLALFGVREFTREPRRALAAWAQRR